MSIRAVFTVAAFALVVICSVTVGRRLHSKCHRLAGYLLVGLLSTEHLLNLVVHADALAYLRWVSLPCRAFIAFETGTHLAAWGEVKHWRRGSLAVVSAPGRRGSRRRLRALRCARSAAGALQRRLLARTGAAPALAGALSTTTAVAVGLVFSTAEPTARVDLSHEYHAQGVFTATGLRVGTGIAMLSAAALLFGAPVIITAHNPPLYSLLSSLVSLVLTVVVALLLWRLAVLIIWLPAKQLVMRISPKLALRYPDECAQPRRPSNLGPARCHIRPMPPALRPSAATAQI